MKYCPSCGKLLADQSAPIPFTGDADDEETVAIPEPEGVTVSYAPAGKPPKRGNRNTLLIIVCAAASVIICALLLYIFIGNENAADRDDDDEGERTEETRRERKRKREKERDLEYDDAARTRNRKSGAEAEDNPWEWLSQRPVTASDIRGKSAAQLRIMRNAIFARHGYIFKSSDLEEYFSRYPWYRPRYSDVTDRLNEVERSNVAHLKKYEASAPKSPKSSAGRLQDVGWTDDYSDVVCHVKLTDNDVAGLSKAQIRILRNTIYARHGRKFKSADLRDYFSGFSWYHGVYDEISPNSLSDIERHNIVLLQKYE